MYRIIICTQCVKLFVTIVNYVRYRVWSSTCPFTSRSTMMTVVGTYFLGLLLPNLAVALNNSLYWTIKHFEGRFSNQHAVELEL